MCGRPPRCAFVSALSPRPITTFSMAPFEKSRLARAEVCSICVLGFLLE